MRRKIVECVVILYGEGYTGKFNTAYRRRRQICIRERWLDMDSGAYSRTFTVHFSYRFGSYKERKHKEVDTSRFGH